MIKPEHNCQTGDTAIWTNQKGQESKVICVAVIEPDEEISPEDMRKYTGRAKTPPAVKTENKRYVFARFDRPDTYVIVPETNEKFEAKPKGRESIKLNS